MSVVRVKYPGPAVTDPDAQKRTHHRILGVLEGNVVEQWGQKDGAHVLLSRTVKGKEYTYDSEYVRPYVNAGLFEAIDPLPALPENAPEPVMPVPTTAMPSAPKPPRGVGRGQAAAADEKPAEG